jgi:methionine synthase II (cobalamin-independent)
MFATLASGYPAGPLPGLAGTFAEARQRRASDALDEDAYRTIADDFVAEIVREQVMAGLSMVSDGHVRWPGGLVALADGLTDGSITPADVVAAWKVVAGATDGASKQVLPGPYSTSRARASDPPGRRRISAQLVETITATIDALAAVGCEAIQIDESPAVGIGDDIATWRSFADELTRVVAAVPEGVHRSLALTGGAAHPAGHAFLADLPFQSYLVDVLAGPDAWRLIASLPEDRGVICGVLDVNNDRPRDDPEMMLWAATLAAETNDRGAARVGISPNGDMDTLTRFVAKRKIERMGLSVHLSGYGPLSDVARALQPDPRTCKIPSLRKLIAEYDEAVGGWSA